MCHINLIFKKPIYEYLIMYDLIRCWQITPHFSIYFAQTVALS